MTEEDNESKDKSLFIFGRDVSKIPCFRNSILYGIYSGLGMGLAHFMFKSRPVAACNFAVYSFSAITLLYWIQCRYKYSKTKFEMMQMQELLRKRALYEGTSFEKEVNSTNSETVDT